ncbi:PadR family transcriptional regulator [Paenibacillus sp. SYP-B4298]|uniref:PadR family transcriptional regulator n=1 Tax=Paenibacillus sp. SYP-B4298 TaxID=2996034 RepID=UPI0022DD57E6|nr:helix-turn-helix transcriptional regulator [Paenibacillus sp. SYP-B4298]
MREKDAQIDKESSLGHVVRVQHVIDYMVLAELQHGRRYGKQIDRVITTTLQGVGVNDSYLAQRMKKLAEKGHATSRWDDDNRYNRYYEITDSGREYFRQLQRDLPERVALALKVYKLFEQTIQKHQD